MKLKRIFLIVLAIVALFCVMSLTSCEDDADDNNEPQKVNYTVSLSDSQGEPVQFVVVTMMLDGETLGMKPTDAGGKATFELYPDNYTFTLTATGGDSFDFDESSLTFEDNTYEKRVTLYEKLSSGVELYNDFTAYLINEGSYRINYTNEALSYFLFIPERAGRYKLTVNTPTAPVEIGNYGSPAYIHETDISLDEDKAENAIYIDVRSFNIGDTPETTTQYLAGIKGISGGGSGVLTLEYVSKLDPIPSEFPWTEYQKTAEITPFAFPGGTLTNFDITNTELNVVLGDDGVYHLGTKDGPVIYVKLSVDNAYTVSFKTILETQYFGCYVNDQDGKFLYKVSYHKMMLDYIAESEREGNEGLYPLTYDIAVAIKAVGEHLGWYKSASENKFLNNVVITDNAWLFACCYVSSGNDGE